MQELIDKASVLIEALPYIQQFRGAVVVVKFGGSAMEDPERTESVLRDIVFMECAGMKPVILHGGGKAISARLKHEGIESRFVNGLRHTCERTIRVVDDVLHNDVNAALVAGINRHGGRARTVSGREILRAEPLPPVAGQDLGYVGRVINVDTEQIRWMVDRNEVPVVTPLGTDLNGCIYNINADMAACELAAEMQADKLVFLSDVPGILRDKNDTGSLVSTVPASEMESYIAQGVIEGGMVPKLRSAVRALEAGTGKVHMIDGRVQHALLLEIFTDEGIGTQIIH